jgi:predicted RNase H-like HicB family nuclease
MIYQKENEMDLKYGIVIERTSDPKVFRAIIPDLPKCKGLGYTIQDATDNAIKSMNAFISTLEASNKSMPPRTSKPSIKLNLVDLSQSEQESKKQTTESNQNKKRLPGKKRKKTRKRKAKKVF